MEPPSPRATIADVALLAGVSRATVSKALNDKYRVDPETRDRVRRAAEDLGYRASVRAQRLRGGRSHTIALITALPAPIVGEASQLGFLLDLALPTAQACLEHGYSLLLVPPIESSDALDMLDVDGAIVIDPVSADPYCAALRSRGVSVVSIGRAESADVDACVDRGAAGAEVMLPHLAARGARHALVLMSEEDFSITATIEQHLASRPADGLRISTVRAPAGGGEESGRIATLAALDREPGIDAVYAPLDAFAVGALAAAREKGLSVPGDLMVATNYDGRRATSSEPALTALDLRLPAIARSAVTLLLSVLAGVSPADASAPVPSVVERASTRR